MKTLCVCLLLCAACRANAQCLAPDDERSAPIPGAALNSLIDNPRPKPLERTNKRIFFISTAALALSKSWDAETTLTALRRGAHEVDVQWAVGSRPSATTLSLLDASVYVATVTSFFFTERSHNRWIRWTGRTVMGLSIGGATGSGFRNNQYCRPATVCVGSRAGP